MGIITKFWKGYYVSLDTFSWKVRRSVCNSGFGSTCSSCSDGFTLPDRPLYHRVTCVKDCELEGCRKCYDGFIDYCKACEPGYALTNKGYCRKREWGSGGGHWELFICRFKSYLMMFIANNLRLKSSHKIVNSSLFSIFSLLFNKW